MSKIKINNCDYKIHPMYDMICMPLLKMVKLFTLKRIPIIGNLQKMDICEVVSVNLDKQDKNLSILNMGYSG